MSDINFLNNLFGDALGRPDGTTPRFAWTWSNGLLGGQNWAISQLAPNPFTLEQWTAIHEGRRPYPGKLRWIQHSETALPFGTEPTLEDTQFYVRSLRAQMEAAEKAEKDAAAGRIDDATLASEADAKAHQDIAATEFYESIASWEPPSWALGEPQPAGSQDGPIAFQVGGSRDGQPQPAPQN